MDSITRIEKYLEGIENGGDVPVPVTRIEKYLYEIAQGGGGGGGFVVSDTAPSNTGVLWIDPSDDTTFPAGTNVGDLLVWNGTEWVARPKWQGVFQPVEYIESTGTQYLKLDVASADGYEITFAMTEFQNNNSAFGYRTGDQQTRLGSIYYNGLYLWQNNNVNTKINNAEINTFYNAKAGAKFDNKIIVNGDELATNVSISALNKLGVFACYDSNGFMMQSKAKIRNLDLYNGNTLIVHLVPCYSIIDGEIGMYDTVNSKFYTNAGTGTFNKGADV